MQPFADFAAAAAPVAVRALWQGLAVAALLALALQIAPRLSAAQRFAVWSAGFAAAAALPFLPSIAERLIAPTTASTSISATAPHAWLELDPRWSLALIALWFVVSAVRFASLAVHTVRIRSLWRSARPVDLPQFVLGRRYQICVSDSIDRPSVIGFFSPRVLLPSWLFPQLTQAELEQVVLHEIQHLRRHDDWTNLAQKLILALFPLSPALHFIDRRLSREREMACDEAVVRITRAPRAYAACLASLAERGLTRRAAALSLGAFERRPELVDRVHTILRGARTLPPAASAALLGALACVLAAVSFGLAQCPQLVAFVAPSPAPARQIAAVSSKPLPVASFSATPVASKPVRTRQTKAAVAAPAPAAQPEQLATLRAQARPAAPQPEQFVVFTAYEQLPSARTTAQARADYDGADAVIPEQPLQRIRVTQLILRVTPPSSHTDHLTAVPLGDGWLVFQL
ncbi:MAG: M56 family metallopeptidase [Terracidiphilus sp.]|nr:M56 family metallopeptidase [Terracidiphilus sp.]